MIGDGINGQSRWTEFIHFVKALLFHNVFLEQDYLVRMIWKAKEPWLDFMDHYWLYVETCITISYAVKIAKLYHKLPQELRLQLGHVLHDATLTTLYDSICGVRYWSHCAEDRTIPFDPMELDAHLR